MSGFNPIQASASTRNDVMLSQVDLRGPQFGLLTPETLLDFCAMKLRGIDEQVQRAFMKQQDRNKLSAALGDLANVLQSSKTIPDDASGDGMRAEVSARFDAAIAAAGPNTAVGKDLQAQKDAFTKTITPSGEGATANGAGADENEMKRFVDTLTRTQANVNREGELEMIQLQSLMSQRQQAIQMCTNLVSGLGQSSMAIAQNMGK